MKMIEVKLTATVSEFQLEGILEDIRDFKPELILNFPIPSIDPVCEGTKVVMDLKKIKYKPKGYQTIYEA